MPPASTSGCQQSTDCVVNELDRKYQVSHSCRELDEWTYLFTTYFYTHENPACLLGAYCFFPLSCIQITKNFNQMKDFSKCRQRDLVYYFTTFWATTVIWLKWKAGIFLTGALLWTQNTSTLLWAERSGASERDIQGLLDMCGMDSLAVGPAMALLHKVTSQCLVEA